MPIFPRSAAADRHQFGCAWSVLARGLKQNRFFFFFCFSPNSLVLFLLRLRSISQQVAKTLNVVLIGLLHGLACLTWQQISVSKKRKTKLVVLKKKETEIHRYLYHSFFSLTRIKLGLVKCGFYSMKKSVPMKKELAIDLTSYSTYYLVGIVSVFQRSRHKIRELVVEKRLFCSYRPMTGCRHI